MNRATRRAVIVVLIGLISGWGLPGNAAAEDATPTVPQRVQALAGAFEQIALRAESGSWQSADAAFNDAVGLLDALRPGLIAEAGEGAVTATGGVDALLGDLIAALDAEDAAAVRAVVALVRTQLRPVAPNVVAPGASALATRLLLDWRSDVAAALAAGEAGRWNDMRDAANDLAARMERSGGSVLLATGDAGSAHFQRALVFTMRVRSAALDRLIGDAEASAAVAESSLAELLRIAAGETAPVVPGSILDDGIVFRALTSDATAGSATMVAILAESIPDVGLGAFKLRVRWSSAALSLRDVDWDVAQGSVDRGGGAGTVVLEWPPAPTGPRGSSSLARLTFDVLGAGISPRDYLPADDLASLEARLADAHDKFVSADVPQAGAEVMEAYLAFREGAEVPGSLWAALAERGLEVPLEGALINLLEALSRPAEPDVILERFELSSSLLSATVDSFAAPFAMPGQVPIVVEALEAFDTRGQPLPVRASQVVNIRVSGSAPPPTSPAVPSPQSNAMAEGTLVVATIVPGTEATTASGGGTGLRGPVPSASGPRRQGTPLPVPLLVTLLGAAVAGGAAVLWSRRRSITDSETRTPGR